MKKIKKIIKNSISFCKKNYFQISIILILILILASLNRANLKILYKKTIRYIDKNIYDKAFSFEVNREIEKLEKKLPEKLTEDMVIDHNNNYEKKFSELITGNIIDETNVVIYSNQCVDFVSKISSYDNYKQAHDNALMSAEFEKKMNEMRNKFNLEEPITNNYNYEDLKNTNVKEKYLDSINCLCQAGIKDTNYTILEISKFINENIESKNKQINILTKALIHSWHIKNCFSIYENCKDAISENTPEDVLNVIQIFENNSNE